VIITISRNGIVTRKSRQCKRASRQHKRPSGIEVIEVMLIANHPVA
jgi:hypothetical protein